MKYIELEGVKQGISRLIMGSDYFAPEKMEQVSSVLDSFVSIGGNTIDTAYIYYGGKSEQAIGLWVQERKNRDKINIWTKGAHVTDQVPIITKSMIYDELMVSLERLQTDYVDLYALHRDDRETPVGQILEWLNEHVEAGRIRAFGGSNWTPKRLQEANDYAAANGLKGFSFSSPNLSLAKAKEPFWANCVSIDDEALAWHEQSQLPVFSWSSQARGFFTGRFSPDNHSDADLVRVFYNDDNWERYRRAEQIAKEKGVSTIQIALAYVLNQSFPTCALVGPQNESEMKSCEQAVQIELSPEEIRWLDLRQR